MNESILLVEDEEGLRVTLTDRLESEGYVVDFASDGLEGFDKATQHFFDLIILDIMLPRRSGLDVCRDLRQTGMATPILLLTARGQVTDKVVGLKLGADDYVTKPFDTQELMARIEALLRRAPNRSNEEIRHFGDVSVNLRGTQVTRAGGLVDLSAREFQLLRYFIERAGTTLTRDHILRHVWGYQEPSSTRTVDVHVANLRQKLETDPKRPQLIVTVPGLGYKFVG